MNLFINKLKTAIPEVGTNAIEVVCYNGRQITTAELMEANTYGFVYHSSQTNIEFDDKDENGNPITKYMDIHYFSIAPKDIHKHQIHE